MVPALSAALLMGCGPEEHTDGDPTASAAATPTATATAEPTPTEEPTDLGPGMLNIRFEMDTDYIDAMPEGEEPVGRFWGAVYYTDEVTGAGPVPGATILESIYIEEVDVTGGGPTDVLYTTIELPAADVSVLGFLDSDANAEDFEGNPDSKDPVTLPGDNRFEVIGGTTTEITVHFGFLNP